MASPNFDKDLVDNFQASSVLLALATVFFSLQYQRILDALEEPRPDGPVARKSYEQRLWSAVWWRVGPLCVFSGVSAYLFLPMAIAIIRTSRTSLLDFNFLRTTWLFMIVIFTASFAWSAAQGYRLTLKAKDARKNN